MFDVDAKEDEVPCALVPAVNPRVDVPGKPERSLGVREECVVWWVCCVCFAGWEEGTGERGGVGFRVFKAAVDGLCALTEEWLTGLGILDDVPMPAPKPKSGPLRAPWVPWVRWVPFVPCVPAPDGLNLWDWLMARTDAIRLEAWRLRE